MKKASIAGLLFFVGFCSFAIGRISPLTSTKPKKVELESKITLIDFLERNGDQLVVNISGPGRVTWAGGMVEGTGQHTVLLGQISTPSDRDLESFQYLGNTSTGNFYPTSSYPARGTKVEYRRYFQTKQEALSAGFTASKLVD